MIDKDKIIQVIHSIRAICNSSSSLQLHEPEITDLEHECVRKCLESGWVSSSGEYITSFEKKITEFTKIKYAVATVNGTSALQLCLIAAGIKQDEEVLLPTMSFIATANAVSYLQGIPHFIDISLETLGVDAEKLRIYLTEIATTKNGLLYNKQSKRKISALIVMHSFGQPCNMDKLVEVCKEFKIKLIEDAAESLGSFYRGKHTGSFGELSAFSFNGNKIITTGGGGCVVTNNEELAKLVRHLSTTAKIPNRIASQHDMIGYNYRMPNLNASLGLAQIEQLEKKIKRKRTLAAKYQKELSIYNEFSIYQEFKDNKTNYWLNLLILNKNNIEDRNNIITLMHQHNIFVRPVWELLHTQKMYQVMPRMPDLSSAASLFNRIICLPSSAQLIK